MRGQASILLIGILAAALTGTLVLGAVARGMGRRDDLQRAADLAALAGARALLDAYPRRFEPARVGRRPNPSFLSRAAYVALGVAAARATARANGADVQVRVPDRDPVAPLRVRVEARSTAVFAALRLPLHVVAEAGLAPGRGSALPLEGSPRSFAHRQGKPMRPDVALAFDRLAAAAARAGVGLVIVSAYRSDAEQAVLFARHPDPRWVAAPGRSLHRLGTELDLGPASAYGWLRANAARLGWIQRYAWEPWHWGWRLNARSAPTGRGDGALGSAVPDFVPARWAPALARAAQRWNVSAALLAAQLDVESGFDPGAVSAAGARGIAQFTADTAHRYGLRDPHDPVAAIDAQGRLMRDLLRRFGSVALALAAFNAGETRVAACGCIPPLAETQAYVVRVLGRMGGLGDLSGGGLEVRLVA